MSRTFLDQRQTRLLASAAGILSVLACATSSPDPPQLAVEAPPAWTAATTLELSPAGLSEADSWWTHFADPNLDRLVRTALDRNRDLAAAAERIAAATARARIAGADLWPQLTGDVAGARRKQNFIGFPIPGREGEVLSATTSTFGVNLNLSWEVDLWGRLRAQKGATLARLEATTADFAAARLSLAGQTAKAWFAVLEAQRQLALAEATQATRRLSRERIQRRYLLGTRPALDLRFALTNESAARAIAAARRRQLDLALRQLEILMSVYPDGAIDLDLEDASLPEPPATLPAGLPAELVARRPDLVAGERRLAAAGLDTRQARARLYPQFRLTGAVGTLSAEVEDLVDDDLSVWSLAANILQPLFQGGRLRGGVQLSEALYRELAESYAQLVLRAFGEVESALAAEAFLAEQERSLVVAAKQSMAAETLAQQRYDAGLQDYLAVLEAQRNSFLAQSELLSARRLRLDRRVDLILALGGAFGESVPNAERPGNEETPSP